MHSLWNEVFPAAPVLLPLGEAAGALTVIALIAIVTALVAAFVYVINRTVGRLPLVGGIVSVAAHALEDGVTRSLAGWSASAHRHLGAAMHSLARGMDWVGHELEQHSRLLNIIGTLLIGRGNLTALENLIRRLLHGQTQQRTINQAQAQRITHTHDLTLANARENHLTHKIAVALPGQVAREWDIPKLRERTKVIEHGLARAWDWIRSHKDVVVSGALVGAVAVALTRLGLSWVRCESAKSFFKKRGCGAWPALDKLLGLFADVLLVANICTVIPWLEEAFSVVAAPLIGRLTQVGAGICSARSGPPEFLPPPGLYLPASPSITLYLP